MYCVKKVCVAKYVRCLYSSYDSHVFLVRVLSMQIFNCMINKWMGYLSKYYNNTIYMYIIFTVFPVRTCFLVVTYANAGFPKQSLFSYIHNIDDCTFHFPRVDFFTVLEQQINIIGSRCDNKIDASMPK